MHFLYIFFDLFTTKHGMKKNNFDNLERDKTYIPKTAVKLVTLYEVSCYYKNTLETSRMIVDVGDYNSAVVSIFFFLSPLITRCICL